MLVLLLLLVLQSDNQASLVGRWDSEKRSPGEVGSWLQLLADGTCTRTVGLSIDGRWKLDRNRLTVTTGPRGAEFVKTTVVSVTADAMTQTSGTTRVRRSRVSLPEPGSSPEVIGVWSYAHPAGGTAYDEYTKEGRFLFRLPATTMRCQWNVAGDRLAFSEGAQTELKVWPLVSDRLRLGEGPDELFFRRERSDFVPVAPERAPR